MNQQEALDRLKEELNMPFSMVKLKKKNIAKKIIKK